MNEEHARRAQARADKVSESTDYKELERCAKEALKAPLLAHRIFWLHRMADTLTKATKGHVPCDNGCSHCCYQPVMMSYTEARYIGRKIGIVPQVPKYRIEANLDFVGHKCPFLKDDKCSIYEHRPFACRVYYSVDDSPEPCKLTEPYVPGIVANLDNMQFHAVEYQALGEALLQNADIRDFFGKELK